MTVTLLLASCGSMELNRGPFPKDPPNGPTAAVWHRAALLTGDGGCDEWLGPAADPDYAGNDQSWIAARCQSSRTLSEVVPLLVEEIPAGDDVDLGPLATGPSVTGWSSVAGGELGCVLLDLEFPTRDHGNFARSMAVCEAPSNTAATWVVIGQPEVPADMLKWAKQAADLTHDQAHGSSN